jgi:two-component system cell cycle sensor histidine kinase/response regulator CckA
VATAAAHGDGKAGGAVTLAVDDTGVGMDEATRARAFEPYFTTKAGGRGSGLGLSTVFGIVSQHGGHVDVTSAPGRGSTFRVCLPVVGAASSATVVESGSVVTVIVLEDDPRVRDLIVEILERYDYRALPAATVDEALAHCGGDRNRIALVVAAVRALGGPGAEFGEWLRAVAPAAKVLYLTDDPAGHEHAATLIKPFTVEALVDSVRRVLTTPSATG